MAEFIALTYTTEVDWKQPEYAEGIQAYIDFDKAHQAVLRGGRALYPTATARTVTAPEGREPIVSDGPYAETKEVLTGFYLLECADLDEAMAIAARIPAVTHGTVEVRQLHPPLDS